MFKKNLILSSGFLILIVLILSFYTFTADNLRNILLSPASTQSTVIDKERFQNKTAATAANEEPIDTGLIVKLLTDNLETTLNKSAAILEVTSKLPEVNSAFYATSINSELHGIPQDLDISKREVAQDALQLTRRQRPPPALRPLRPQRRQLHGVLRPVRVPVRAHE